MKYEKLLKYPHLGPEDAKIWDRFIAQNPTFFDSVEYDVKVGEGRSYSMFPDSNVREDMRYLSKKRIDVVGFDKGKTYVIELKPKATLAAIGQVEGLSDLYRETFKAGGVVIPCIITNEEIPDMRRLCKKRGIEYFIV